MRKYIAIVKYSFIGSLYYKYHYFFMFLANISSIFITYFLWKAVYGHTGGTINSMSFREVFVYLAMSSSMFFLFQTWIEYDFSKAVITGNIVVDMIKPYDLQLKEFSRVMGFVLCKVFTVLLPSMLVIFLFFSADASFGSNVLYFIPALIFAFFISFNIDYIVALIAFYTQSVWGLSLTKEILVLLLSGAVIPLRFFPDNIAAAVKMMPFHAIYNIPMTILTSTRYPNERILQDIVIQAAWCCALMLFNRLLYLRISKAAVINGG